MVEKIGRNKAGMEAQRNNANQGTNPHPEIASKAELIGQVYNNAVGKCSPASITQFKISSAPNRKVAELFNQKALLLELFIGKLLKIEKNPAKELTLKIREAVHSFNSDEISLLKNIVKKYKNINAHNIDKQRAALTKDLFVKASSKDAQDLGVILTQLTTQQDRIFSDEPDVFLRAQKIETKAMEEAKAQQN